MKAITTLLFLTVSGIGNGQSIDNQVISSAGNFLEAANGSLSTTIGESCAQTLIRPQIILTQGFQQPVFVITDVSPIEQNHELEVLVYPNPTPDFLHIKTTKNGLYYKVYTQSGKVLFADQLRSQDEVLNLNTLSNGMLFIEIYSKTLAFKKIYKITKIQ